jgi:hypothetical protein
MDAKKSSKRDVNAVVTVLTACRFQMQILVEFKAAPRVLELLVLTT